MTGSTNLERSVTRRTFAAEAVRSVTAGVLETAFATFAVLIAVTQFSSGAWVKSTLFGSQAIGMIGSLMIVPLVMHLRLKVSHGSALISLLSMGGFLIAAVGAKSEFWFIFGICIGLGVAGLAMPLQVHNLRHNYPGNKRGRLFSANVFIRSLSALLTTWLLGNYLDVDMGRYPTLLWIFTAAAGLAAICQFAVPSSPLEENKESRPSVFESMAWLKKDPVFARVIFASMVMGMGVLSANALRVDYLVNPDHGLVFDVKTVALISGIVPSVIRLGSTFFWGWLFDRTNFFRLRIIVNGVFLCGIVFYFAWTDVRVIIVGSALFGLARGGGEILFNLWVTKLAGPKHIAEYMSVHTFFAGIRIFMAPFLGFYLVQSASISRMFSVSFLLVLISMIMIWPLMKNQEKTNHD